MNLFKTVTLSAAIASMTLTTYGASSPSPKTITTQGLDVTVEFFSPDVVRILKTPQGHRPELKSLVVVKTPETVNVATSEMDGFTIFRSDSLTVKVNNTTGGIEFLDSRNNRLLLDKDYGTNFIPDHTVKERPTYQVQSSFLLEEDEPIYGIGQVMDGRFNRRDSNYHLQNENCYTYSPYFLSPTKGYGVYWDNYSISDLTDTPQGLTYTSTGDTDDYYFLYGPTPGNVISNLRDLTGKAPMLPLWAYGFFQSWCQYNTQDELLDALKKYREMKVPVDCMIQDWRYWPEYNGTDSLWNSHSFDPQRFPDPVKWTDDIHNLNAKLMIVAWPGFGPKTKQYQELEPKGYIIPFDTWPPNSGAKPYDVYSDEARDIYWKYLNNGIYSHIGNDGWWLDSTEPDHINKKPSDYLLPTSRDTYRNVKNAYSLMHNEGIASHQKEFDKSKRVVILTRSGFIGQQRYGSNTWSGDVASTWQSLANHIPAAQHYALMGIPNWNSDIGGYFSQQWVDKDGNIKEGYPELYTRWMQFGAFCPMMRSHGLGAPRELWHYGKRGDADFDALEKMVKLRYRLLPYIYSTSYDVSANNGLFIRPLMLDFTSDKNVYDQGGEYMFGKSILVSPVTAPGVTEWDVYLPEGSRWWDFWTNESIEGGQTRVCPVTADILPLHVKEGTILPFGPEVQYSTEKPWDNLEIRVYPGSDATFTLYEDENDNYNYESGAFSTIDFNWNDKSRTLTISDRKGTYPGMLSDRKFKVVVVDKKSGAGDKPMKGGKSVAYNGREVKVKF